MKLTSWSKRAKETASFHAEKVRGNHRWTIEDTADELRRSEGSVNEDLILATFLKSHPKIEDIDNIRDALKFVREKKLEMKKRD